MENVIPYNFKKLTNFQLNPVTFTDAFVENMPITNEIMTKAG